ncbi:hypothetical protein Q7P35_005536 [Cladosporium inversicolor]
MLYNVHSKGHMCTQDEHTFDVHVDLRVTIRFDSSLNPVELQHVQQSTLQRIENSLNFQDSTGGVTQPPAIRCGPNPRKANKSVTDRDNNALKTIARVETVEDNGNVPQNAVSAVSRPRDETINNSSYTHDSELATKSVTGRDTHAHNTIARVETVEDNGNVPQNAVSAISRPRDETINNSSYTHDSKLAQGLCLAISQAAVQIKNKGVPGWWSDVERLKPKCNVLHHADEALYAEELDRDSVEIFDPKAGYWRKYSKTRMLKLASQIVAILLTSEFENLWRDADMKLAFDPAEFFATASSFGGTSPSSTNLSYNRIQKTLGLTDAASGSGKDFMQSGPTVPAIQAQTTGAHCGNIGPAMTPAPCIQWTPNWTNTMPSLPSVDIPSQTGPNAVPYDDFTWSATALETLPPPYFDRLNTLCGEMELCAMPNMTPLWPPEGDGPISASSGNWKTLCGEVEISTM